MTTLLSCTGSLYAAVHISMCRMINAADKHRSSRSQPVFGLPFLSLPHFPCLALHANTQLRRVDATGSGQQGAGLFLVAPARWFIGMAALHGQSRGPRQPLRAPVGICLVCGLWITVDIRMYDECMHMTSQVFRLCSGARGQRKRRIVSRSLDAKF